jgi:hypothetical protein
LYGQRLIVSDGTSLLAHVVEGEVPPDGERGLEDGVGTP